MKAGEDGGRSERRGGWREGVKDGEDGGKD